MEATRQIVLSLLSLLLCTAFATDVGYGQQQKAAKAKLNALEMKSVPDGHFLVKLQVGGQERLLNIESKNDSAKCVTTDNPKLKGLRGRFQLIGNGVFWSFFRTRIIVPASTGFFEKTVAPPLKKYRTAAKIKRLFQSMTTRLSLGRSR